MTLCPQYIDLSFMSILLITTLDGYYLYLHGTHRFASKNVGHKVKKTLLNIEFHSFSNSDIRYLLEYLKRNIDFCKT